MRKIILLFLVQLLPSAVLAQLIQAEKNLVCPGEEINLRINPLIFNDLDFCVQFEREVNGLYYFSSCKRLSFDDAYAYAKLMRGSLATANTPEKNALVASIKAGNIKWLGIWQNPENEKFNDPPDPASGFEWMSQQENTFYRWARDFPNKREDTNPGMHVIIGCSNESPGTWCDVNKNDGHNYFAVVETKFREVPVIPQITVRWDNGSTERQTSKRFDKTQFVKVSLFIDGIEVKDSIRINVREVKADFRKPGGCGDPFLWSPEVSLNFPANEAEINWQLGEAISQNTTKPTLNTFSTGFTVGRLQVNDTKCGLTIFDSTAQYLLEYPFEGVEHTKKIVRLNETIEMLTKNASPNFFFSWSPENGLDATDKPRATFIAEDSTYYICTIDDGYGCEIKETFEYTIDPNFRIYMPTIFTPNGDGKNDVLQIITNTGFYGELRQFNIFDRNGHLLFSSEKTWEWDGSIFGQMAAPGLYVYQIKYEIEKVPYEKQGVIILEI